MRKRINKHEKMKHMRRKLRERMRVINVIVGIGSNMTVMEIHRKTGLSQKNIRKIMLDNPNEITFALLKKEDKNEQLK